MTIQLNGSPHPLEAPCTVAALLESLDMKGKPVVVELNGQALTPREFSSVVVENGATVEIVSIVAGG